MTMFDLSRLSLPNNKHLTREGERKIGRVRERERAVGVACDMIVYACAAGSKPVSNTHTAKNTQGRF